MNYTNNNMRLSALAALRRDREHCIHESALYHTALIRNHAVPDNTEISFQRYVFT
jgi:hypothetical protein